MKLRSLVVWGAVVGLAGGVAYFGYKFSLNKSAHAAADAVRGELSRGVVRTVHPKRDPAFRISNQQIAIVEPFYQAGLRARASGVVKSVSKDIGEPVSRGELLLEIDVPDLAKDVDQKLAVIEQRHQELRVSKAMVRHALAAVEAAKAGVSQKRAEVKQAEATRDFRLKLLTRFQGLLKTDSIRPEIVDEQERDYLAAEAAVDAVRVAVRKAQADEAEKEASVEAARADEDLKRALIAVSEADRDRALAAAEFARITAPFDGVIVRRNADPGAFVQNATTSASEPLITLARVDLVTVVMKLPDTAAAYVSRDTEVEIEFDDIPGLKIRGKVTRYAPVIDGNDRTLRLEVDVFNGTRADFQRFMARTVAEIIVPFGQASPISVAAANIASACDRQLFHKGVSEGVAVCPDLAKGPTERRLLPGMPASMRVYLDRVAEAYLLPSNAVYSSGGKTFILVVRDGVTRQLPVRVQVNDGRMAKVAFLASGDSPAIREMSPTEEVVVTRQLEVGDAARVRAVLGEW